MKSYRLRDLSSKEQRELIRRNPVADPAIMEKCNAIFEDILRRGDGAVRDYTRQFDHVELLDFRVSKSELSQARRKLSDQVLEALQVAARNIRKFHAAQLLSEGPVEVQTGVMCWRESRPIASVGLYVPAGTAVLPSTVLMLGIPAALVGCSRVILCLAPAPDGSVAPGVLAAAEIAGITEVFKIGGAQAIAAMALGTQSVPQVEKILGPGNRWVQGAKLVASLRGAAIDMVAGPTEVLIVADDTASADFVAADLISQAEHGSDSLAILVSTSPRLVEEVTRLVWRKLEDLPRKRLAESALEGSFALLVGSLEEAFEFSNRYAPEHLILHLASPRQSVPRIQCAGSVFLGPWSPEVAGDYASGTNHTLPTSGSARVFSGVSVDSYLRKIIFQELSRQGLQDLAPTLETLAELEELEGHRRAVRERLES